MIRLFQRSVYFKACKCSIRKELEKLCVGTYSKQFSSNVLGELWQPCKRPRWARAATQVKYDRSDIHYSVYYSYIHTFTKEIRNY